MKMGWEKGKVLVAAWWVEKKFSHNGNGNTRQVCGQVVQGCLCVFVCSKQDETTIYSTANSFRWWSEGPSTTIKNHHKLRVHGPKV